MTAKEAIAIIFPVLKNEPVVCATGYLSRAAQAVRNRPENFYMIGSMGMVSAFALGIALAKPRRKVIALDGDGAVLMNLGTLPAIGALGAQNLVHIVLDNASYESTGGQRSYTDTVRLERIAKASGYRTARRVRGPAALKKEARTLLSRAGPVFLLVEIENDKTPPAARIAAAPEQITRTFSEGLA